MAEVGDAAAGCLASGLLRLRGDQHAAAMSYRRTVAGATPSCRPRPADARGCASRPGRSARSCASGRARDGLRGAPGTIPRRAAPSAGVSCGGVDQSADTRRSPANGNDSTTVSACSHRGFRLACRRSIAVGGKGKPMDRRGKPKKAKTDAKRSPARKPTKDDSAKAPDLKRRVAEGLSREAEASKREAEALGKLQTRDRELAEAQDQLTAAHAQVRESHEQQTATSEILRVISSSPTELQPVVDARVKRAARFCAADDALIHRLEGDGLQVVAAHHGPIPTPAGFVTPVHGTASGRSVLERRAVHVADIAAEAEMFPEGSAIARALGFRTMLSVPLLREGVPLGTIVLRRSAVEPFSEKQIALLQTCADQAVIAIENARLLTELQQRNEALTQAHAQVSEALEQQTATAEILSVISGSPTDIRPVFDAVLDRALT